MKQQTDRIRYYVHKVTQYMAQQYPQRKPGSLRFKRLEAYKRAMNKSLNKEK